MVISLVNWIRGSIVTCFGLFVCSGHLYILCGNVCLYVNIIRIRYLIFCITLLQLNLNVLALWLLQLLLLSGDVETNPGPVCQKCLADVCICSVKVKPRHRPSKQCLACASPVPCRRLQSNRWSVNQKI